jgi:hypothetical protein
MPLSLLLSSFETRDRTAQLRRRESALLQR